MQTRGTEKSTKKSVTCLCNAGLVEALFCSQHRFRPSGQVVCGAAVFISSARLIALSNVGLHTDIVRLEGLIRDREIIRFVLNFCFFEDRSVTIV